MTNTTLQVCGTADDTGAPLDFPAALRPFVACRPVTIGLVVATSLGAFAIRAIG